MEPTEQELEDRLRDLGMRLTSPPSDVEELLRLLDQTEIYLSRVEQSPSTSMSDALRPAMNLLITKEFLNHPEADVKVFVAACINEIIRVTAPDAPYNDALMKEIFAMIVDSFEKLDDMSGCLYSKRVSILEIMAKVRSCVVMLDLECDDLILHMFKHFLKNIRPDHPINVFSSMETIMTLILEESEDISQELLICLLSNVQKSKKGVMPVARRLAEKVISNCYMKLKPYFLVAVQSTGTYLTDYSDIVASMFQDSSAALEQNEADDNKICERTVSDELPQESEKLDKPVSCLEEVGAFADKTINVLSNGIMPLGNGNAVVEPISPELKPENSSSGEQCRNVVPVSENNSLGPITEKPGNELNFQYIEAKSFSVQLTDASDSSRVDGDKEASAPTSGRVGQKRHTKTLKSDGASDMVPDSEELLEPEKEDELQPLEGLVGDNTCINSASPSQNPSGSGLPIRRRTTNSQFSEKKSTSYRPVLSAGKKKMSGITTMEKEVSPAMFSEHKDHCLVSISDGKPLQDFAKKSLADSVTAEVAAVGINDEKPLRKEHKDAESVVGDSSRVDGYKEASAPTSGRAGLKRQTKTMKSDSASDMAPETEELLEPERQAEPQPLEDLVGDNACINSASPSHNPPCSGLPIRRRATSSQFSEKKSTSYRPVLSAGKKKMSGITTMEKEVSPAIFSEHKDHCLVSISDGKPSQDSAKKSLTDSVTAEVAAVGINDEKPLRKEHKDAASVVTDTNTSENQWESNINRANDKDVTENDVSAEPCLKKMIVSSNASMEANNDQNHLVKSAGGSLIKKRRRKDSQAYNIYFEVIGREIEVWWPDDEKFYKGVIDAFDPVTQKHRVVYDDGDVEILFLRNERWNYIDSKNFDTGQENDIASPESSLHVPKKKRRASSGKSRRKLSRKSNDIPIQQSGDGNSAVKPIGSPTQITSELGTSLNEQTPESLVKEETNVEQPSQTNNSDKPPEETSIISDNNTSRKFVSEQTLKRKNILASGCRDSPTVTSTGSKFVGKSKGRKGKPRGETVKISRISNEETLKTPSNDDTGIKIESSQTNNSDKAVPDTANALKYGLIIDTDEKMSGRRKKGTVTTTDTNDSAIKNLDGFSQKVAAKTSKRRRK